MCLCVCQNDGEYMREGGGGGGGGERGGVCGIDFCRISGYKYFCRLVYMVIANANIPCVSIEAKMSIFTGKNN